MGINTYPRYNVIMDLTQTKLTRSEWNSIEIPTSKKELDIIQMICKGYGNVNITQNNTQSLLHYLKITPSDVIHDYVFCTYLQKTLQDLDKKHQIQYKTEKYKKNKMKKADIIRFTNTDKQLPAHKKSIFEFVIIEHLTKMLTEYNKDRIMWHQYYYTIYTLMSYNIVDVNPLFSRKIQEILVRMKDEISTSELVKMGHTLIEKNPDLLKYADIQLYNHQKELFTICKQKGPKLISYIAPTGTGKTMSPLGLSENHKVIFVCAARHVGLALAKAAISNEKKVAFAFGCNTADDIRLHYFAATDYVRHRLSGMIAKVDNSVGDKVEIMICDIKSYLCAMYYMMAFNKKEEIIMYWDEPTISMDYAEHEIHPIIHNNWKENLIPNIVLSSATLPHPDEMQDTLADFHSRFTGADTHSIVSFDCKKTIPIINKAGFVEMPHYICKTYEDLCDVVAHCERNKTLLRYIDLDEAIKVIMFMNEYDYITKPQLTIERYFPDIEMVNMSNIKQYYLKLLKNIHPASWRDLSEELDAERSVRYDSSVYVVTKDSRTLTDGPTIFLADDVNKVASFCIHCANIPDRVEKDIMGVIEFNNSLNGKIGNMQRSLEDGTKKDEEKDKKMAEGRVAPAMKQLMTKIKELQTCVKNVELNPLFIPNKIEHLERYTRLKGKNYGTPFTCDITEEVVEKIMLINDVDTKWKLLLLMGIGVFATHNSADYMEIMKELAQKQKLFMIIASSDFIYGTNYQFCHSYIGKDLGYMSQEKCIQAMGRVGRTNLQHDYTIRFRDDSLIYNLFHNEENKPEVRNMNTLLNS